MMIRRLLLTVLLAQIALSQGGGAGSIQGVVVNGYTDLPFPGASVELLGIQHGRVLSRAVRTDSKGEFQFSNVQPGSGYQIVVTGERLLATAYGQKNRNEPWVALTLEPGETLRDLKIPVHPMASIRGRVVDNQGRGLFGARVVALTPAYRGARRVLQGSIAAVTNSRGDYQFSNMPAGVYYIRVTPQNTETAAQTLLSTPARFDSASENGPNGTTSNPEGYPLTYFPSTVAVELAKPINLGTGGDADNTDITVTRVKTGRVRGAVTYDGATVLTGQVILQREETAAESSWTRVAEIREGQFDVRGVLPGSYIAWTRTGDNKLWGRTTVTVRGGETSSIGVKVSPAADISGKLSIEDWTEPVAPDFTQLAVYLVPHAFAPVDISLQRNEVALPTKGITASADGQFTFRGVPPWDYNVVVQPTGTALPNSNSSSIRRLYAKSILNGNSDVADKGLEIGSTFDGTLDILLSQDSGGLNGRVLDEGRENGGSARVVLVPEARHRWDLYLALMASSTGRFQLDGVTPGRYKIFAWRDAPSGSWYDPDFLHAYEDRGLPVQIAPGSAEYVELKRIP
jgi:hypothetical protein